MTNYLEQLNQSQMQAVSNLQGPMMVIAGPGSGKTRVLTYRIAHLIKLGTDAFNILALTIKILEIVYIISYKMIIINLFGMKTQRCQLMIFITSKSSG